MAHALADSKKPAGRGNRWPYLRVAFVEQQTQLTYLGVKTITVVIYAAPKSIYVFATGA